MTIETGSARYLPWIRPKYRYIIFRRKHEIQAIRSSLPEVALGCNFSGSQSPGFRDFFPDFLRKKTRFSMWLRSLSWDGKSNNIATSVGHCHLCSWILRFSLNESESWFSRFANRNSNSKFSNGGWRFSMKINNIGITNYLIMAFHEKIITFHSVIKWSTLTF